MTQKFIIAGAGGQGIMLLGKVLAEAAMYEGKYVTWIPSYGAEVRGGTAHCAIIISGEPIGSPCIDQADTLIIMNSPSLDKFCARVKKGGLVIVNSSLIEDKSEKPGMLKFPFTGIAATLGNVKVANMVALGCLIASKKIVKKETVFEVFRDMAPSNKKELILINQKALEEGMKLR